MKKAKAARVPILENAFEVSLPNLMRAVKAKGDSRVVLDDGVVRTVAIVTQTRLAVYLGGRPWLVDIVFAQCLGDRVRPLLICPRAHEGKYQSLYYQSGELACRHCHHLRYRSSLAATAADRARLARQKLLTAIGGHLGQTSVKRAPFKWRRRHQRQSIRLAELTNTHYKDLKAWLTRKAAN